MKTKIVHKGASAFFTIAWGVLTVFDVILMLSGDEASWGQLIMAHGLLSFIHLMDLL